MRPGPLVPLVLLAALLAACTGGGASTRRGASTAVPIPAPSGTPRPDVLTLDEATALSMRTPATVATPPALFVVQRQDDLWLVSLDHPERTVRLTEPGERGTYIRAVRAGTTTQVYFGVQSRSAQASGHVSVKRIAWPGGPAEVAFGFNGDPRAALTPDGALLTYADATGVRIRALATGAERVFSPRRRCRPGQPNCVDALTPTWSEDGRYLAFRRPFQEDGSVRVIEPFGNSTQEVSTKTWSDPAWSPNGTSMCGVGPDVDGLDNDVRVFEALTFATKPFAAVQPPPGVHVAVTGCRYASAGTLAVAFFLRERTTNPGGSVFETQEGGATVRYAQRPGIAVFDPAGKALALFMGASGTSWMPDGTRLVVQVESNAGRLHLLDLQGRLTPLDLAADRIVAILPE